MTFVTRSSPLCRPNEQTKKPKTTVMAIHALISAGFASIAGNTASIASSVLPENAPPANLKK